jgi:hypothetical protein
MRTRRNEGRCIRCLEPESVPFAGLECGGLPPLCLPPAPKQRFPPGTPRATLLLRNHERNGQRTGTASRAKAGASSRTPYCGSNAQGFRAAYEGVAALVEAQEAVGFLCDSDADADADFPRWFRCGAQPERALGAQVQSIQASCDSHRGG